MRYTLQWTNRAGKCWHYKEPMSKARLLARVTPLLSLGRDGENHAAIITIVRENAPGRRKKSAP